MFFVNIKLNLKETKTEIVCICKKKIELGISEKVY